MVFTHGSCSIEDRRSQNLCRSEQVELGGEEGEVHNSDTRHFASTERSEGFQQIGCNIGILPNTTRPSHCQAYNLHHTCRKVFLQTISVRNLLCSRDFPTHSRDDPEGEENVICYFDDVLILGSDDEEHDRHLQITMKKIVDAGLKLSKEKCSFNQTEIEILGHLVSADGIRPDKTKINAILNMPDPINVT